MRGRCARTRGVTLHGHEHSADLPLMAKPARKQIWLHVTLRGQNVFHFSNLGKVEKLIPKLFFIFLSRKTAKLFLETTFHFSIFQRPKSEKHSLWKRVFSFSGFFLNGKQEKHVCKSVFSSLLFHFAIGTRKPWFCAGPINPNTRVATSPRSVWHRVLSF